MNEEQQQPCPQQLSEQNIQQIQAIKADDAGIAAITNFLTSRPEYAQTIFQSLMPNQYNEENKEKERITHRMQGFDPKDNEVWRQITQKFGANIKQPELLSIATVLSQIANVKLDRDAKRRKTVLIKWFQENWEALSPFLDYVVLEDSNKVKQ